MECIRNVTEDSLWVGASDRRLALFENVFPIPRGISYNSYLVRDDKTVLLDTADAAVARRFYENVAAALDGRPLDYVVLNHMEPDHAASLEGLLVRHPETTLVGNAKTLQLVKQFFDFSAEGRFRTVCEGETLTTGRHTFRFFMAPMVHWPEVMVTYDEYDKALYSADAFGTFGALSGNIFADELDFERDWLPEARRYYANIVGKYGVQVQALLRKAAALDIRYLCPLHGPVWRGGFGGFVELYKKWGAWEPEEQSVLIAYSSVYGNTENAADIAAAELAKRGVRNIAMYDVSATHPSVLVAEAFRCSHILVATTTYNAGIFGAMETVLLDWKSHSLQNRTVAVIENGSWAPAAGRLVREIFASMKGIRLLDETVTLRSALKRDQLTQLAGLCDALVRSMTPAADQARQADAFGR